MDTVAEGLWGLADYAERRGEVGKAIKCLEAVVQGPTSLLPMVEVKTRLRIATLLLRHSHSVTNAKSHLERSHLLLNSIPSSFDLKFRCSSLLSHCYHLIGAITSQKNILHRALDLASSPPAAAADPVAAKLWSCNFYSQLANALIIEGDFRNSVSSLESGYRFASELCYPDLEMFFATSILHVHLMQWEEESTVERAVHNCDRAWASIQLDRQQGCLGLVFYNELLHIFYCLRTCDYKGAAEHVEILDNAMKADLQKTQNIRELTRELDALDQCLSQPDLHSRDISALSKKQAQLQEQLKSMTSVNSSGPLEPDQYVNIKQQWGDKLELAPTPMNGEWLPRSAVYALVDLMVVVSGRPKGLFKECSKRIESGLTIVQDELVKLGITDNVKEVDLQHSAIWMAGVYLMLLMQFLENKVAVDLTRSEFVEAQEALVQMKKWFTRFPTILQACESVIEMLRGQYAHSVGCYSEATFHYIEAAKITESKSMQVMCQIYAAVSYICIGDADSSAQALDLIRPVYRMIDSFAGVREKTCVLFAYGLLLMRQHDLQEARNRLARGLQLTHSHLGNLQLVAQYLTILGSLALALHDTAQAREILRSSLTLAKKLTDIPTQIWVLSVLTGGGNKKDLIGFLCALYLSPALYQELGERGNEMENAEYQRKKVDDLQKRLADAHSSIHHIEIIDKVKLEVQNYHELDVKRALGSSMGVNLDIPESVGLLTPLPASSSRLVELDTGRRGKRKL